MSKQTLDYCETKDFQGDIIPLKQGQSKIYSGGVKPFLDRIGHLDEKKFQQKSIPQTEYSETYDTIFNMCIQREPFNFSELLYNKHSEELIRYNTSTVVVAIENAREKHNLAFLEEQIKRQRCNKWIVDGMRRMFMYLDRFYVPNSEDLRSTTEQGHYLYKINVYDKFKFASTISILEVIRKERDKEIQNRDLLRDSINVFVELGQKLTKVGLLLYKNDFEEAFLKETREYYRLKSRKQLDQDSCPDYMRKAEQYIEEEKDRLTLYIHSSSTEKLMETVRYELLKQHQDELLNKRSGIADLLEKESQEDLTRMYCLYENVEDGLRPISTSMTKHISSLGHTYINESKQGQGQDREHKFVRQLISLHERFHLIVQNNFKNAQIFQKALKEAFEDFVNKEYYTSNLLARFINDVLKKGSKLAVDDFESTLDHVVMVYGYIRDKDVFERDYQIYLANRLLQGVSRSEQAEKRMIGKFKTECGYQQTSKLEGMFKDIQLSQELMESQRKEYLNHSSTTCSSTSKEFLAENSNFELSVNVCTTGCQPTSSVSHINIPIEIQQLCDRFKAFYLKKHSGRRLIQKMDQGRADLQVNFDSGKKILNVSSYQMIILLLFNYSQKLTFKEIVSKTQIPPEDLQGHLLSMCHPKIKIILKYPNSNKVEDSHFFELNNAYKNNLYRVKIPLLLKLVRNDRQQQELERSQNIRRRHQIDAAIVRIMKTRKTAQHLQLVTEVVEQLKARFQPSGVDIKKRIESLIDQEYLERDSHERSTYTYKA